MMDMNEAVSIMSKIELLNNYMDDMNPTDVVNFVRYSLEFAGRIEIYAEHKIDKTASDIDQMELAHEIINDITALDMTNLSMIDLYYIQRCILVFSSSIKNIVCKLMILDGQSNRFTIKI